MGEFFETEAWEDERVTRVIDTLRELYANGGAFLRVFRATDPPAFDRAFPWAGGIPVEAISHFLLSATLAAALPELGAVAADGAREFKWDSPLTLDGEIAKTIFRGGAYIGFKGSAYEAKQLGQGFCAALFAERYDDVLVYHSSRPWGWSTWFQDVAWDGAWLIVDRKERRIFLLVATDTD